MNAHAEVERLLGQMVERTKRDPVIEKLSNQISVLCRAHMEPTTDIDWHSLGLTAAEIRVIETLYSKAGKTVSKGALLDAAYYDCNGDTPDIKIIDVFVCKCRAKLRKVSAPIWIETDHSRGYRLHNEPLPGRLDTARNGNRLYRKMAMDYEAVRNRERRRAAAGAKYEALANAMAA